MMLPPDLQRLLKTAQLGDPQALSTLLAHARRAHGIQEALTQLGPCLTLDIHPPQNPLDFVRHLDTLEPANGPAHLGNAPLTRWTPDTLALWACDCAERVKPFFRFEHPDDLTADALLRSAYGRCHGTSERFEIVQTLKHFEESVRSRNHNPATRAVIDTLIHTAHAVMRRETPVQTTRYAARAAASARRAAERIAQEDGKDDGAERELLFQTERLLNHLLDLSHPPTLPPLATPRAPSRTLRFGALRLRSVVGG